MDRSCVACGVSIAHRSPLAKTCSTACYQWARKRPGLPRPDRLCVGCGDHLADLPPQAKACSRQCSDWAKRHPGVLLKKLRLCEACGADISGKVPTARFCGSACQHWARRYPGIPWAPPLCRTCGCLLNGRRVDAKYCTELCRTRAHLDRHRDKRSRRRALVRGSAVEGAVRSIDVLERDGWFCQICVRPIDPELAWPDPWSKSVDHRVPISKGGAHSMENTQAAHLGCNSKKGARLI